MKKITLDILQEFYTKLMKDGAQIDELKEIFNASIDEMENIISEIDKKYTLKDIGKRIGLHPGTKKNEACNSYFEALLSNLHVLDNLISYSPYGNGGVIEHNGPIIKNAYLKALQIEVMKQTQEDINNFITKRKEKAAAYLKALQNPETLEEFRKFLSAKRKDELTPEQLERYESLVAGKQLEHKKIEDEKRAIVSAVNITADMQVYKTVHSIKGHDLWVVKLSERVEKEVYNDLNNKAKKLNGYYSSYAKNGAIPGFTFTTEEDANKFLDLKNGDQKTDKYEKRSEERATNAINKFFEMSERLKEIGFEAYYAERKENTARRARMAASAQANAEQTIFWGKVLNKLGEKLEAKEFIYLSKINCFTQVVELKDILNSAFSKRRKAENITGDNVCIEKKNYSSNLNFVSSPLPEINKENFERICTNLLNTDGQKMRAARFLKALKRSKREHVIVFSDSAIPNIKKLISAYKGWESDYIKEEIMAYDRIKRMGIDSIELLKMALREFIPCLQVEALDNEQKKEKAIKELERKFIGAKIEGFFPTPENLVSDMIQDAEIQEGETVLEPSAGLGHIADEIKEQYPNNTLHCVEIYGSLHNALKEKGHIVTSYNFLEYIGQYDKIIMNPPFENNQDIKHVLHAYNLLKPGGRIVAIVGEGAFSRSGKTESNFRTWLNEVGGSNEELPEGSFKSGFRSTGANTRKIIIDKPKTINSAVQNSNNQLSMF